MAAGEQQQHCNVTLYMQKNYYVLYNIGKTRIIQEKYKLTRMISYCKIDVDIYTTFVPLLVSCYLHCFHCVSIYVSYVI